MSESDKVEVKDGLLRSLDNPTKWPIQVSPSIDSPKGGSKTLDYACFKEHCTIFTVP